MKLMFRCKSKSIAPRGLDPPCAWDPDVFVTIIIVIIIIMILFSATEKESSVLVEKAPLSLHLDFFFDIQCRHVQICPPRVFRPGGSTARARFTQASSS